MAKTFPIFPIQRKRKKLKKSFIWYRYRHRTYSYCTGICSILSIFKFLTFWVVPEPNAKPEPFSLNFRHRLHLRKTGVGFATKPTMEIEINSFTFHSSQQRKVYGGTTYNFSNISFTIQKRQLSALNLRRNQHIPITYSRKNGRTLVEIMTFFALQCLESCTFQHVQRIYVNRKNFFC